MDEQPSTRPLLPLPSNAWGVFKDALVSGQIGAIIGTVALIIIAGQYLGMIESPMYIAHKSIQESTNRNTAMLISNQVDIREMSDGLNDLTTAMWAVCFIQATTPETKNICKDGMLKQRN